MNSPSPPAPPPGASSSPAPHGTIRLFTLNGIRVFLHWSWLLVAVWQIDRSRDIYPDPAWAWAAAEYLALFGIVLMHEFGHAFATRQTGGHADTILLWPFGGIAFVRAPNRPSAHLWGLAAGPLVNVALFPILWYLSRPDSFPGISIQLWIFFYNIYIINNVLLIFNMLPIYPLDGGQILRTLLWYKLGPLRSIEVAGLIGLIGGGALAVWIGYETEFRSIWPLLILGFILFNAWRAWRFAREERLRHEGLAG